MSDCEHHNKIWYGVEGWDCEDCPESGELKAVYKSIAKSLSEATDKLVAEAKSCRTGCKTQDHSSYGECLSAANIAIDKTSLRP